MRNLFQKIEQTKSEQARVKPYSRRAVELEVRLRDLMLQQIKQEIRAEKRRAS